MSLVTEKIQTPNTITFQCHVRLSIITFYEFSTSFPLAEWAKKRANDHASMLRTQYA